MEFTKLNELIEQASIKLREPLIDIDVLNQWKMEMFILIDKIAKLKLISVSSSVKIAQRSLDPIDWSSARCVAHQVLDSSLDYFQSIRDRLVWRPTPVEIRETIEREPLPEQGQLLEKVCHDTFTSIMPYSMGGTHPRFWGWVTGEGTFGGMLAEMIAATLNINHVGGGHISIVIERTVIQWMRQLFGFPDKDAGGGIIVSGTSLATVICMAVARKRVLGNIRENGHVNGPQLVAYASTETHNCVVKALELLGIGSKAMRLISVDDKFCIMTDELKKAIHDDRENGLLPFCIIGNAGTFNTGAFDNLVELSSIARSENIWFHVDGAYGSLIILDPQRRYRVLGIDQADSLAFDFHKWLHCPHDAGCVLIRDVHLLQSTFTMHNTFIYPNQRGFPSGNLWFNNLGPELSRSFRALKVWFTLKEHGIIKLGEKIAENCEQAQYLISLLEKHNDLIRIVRPATLNIVNFRFEPKELSESNVDAIDAFNNELVADMQLSGIAVPSTSYIQKKLYIRVAIVSHRTTLEDFHIFLDNLFDMYRIRIQTYMTQNN